VAVNLRRWTLLVFKLQLGALKWDRINYTKTLDRRLGQIIRQAAREWLKTVIKSIEGSFPVETGMAAGSLIPMARKLRVAFSVRPTRKPYYSKLEGGVQSLQAGMREQNFYLRDDKTNPMSFIYEFEWTSTVVHYTINESYPIPFVKSETPWHTRRAGDAAAEAYIQKWIDRAFPELEKFVDFE